MKVSKLEWVALVLTALALSAMIFYFAGSRSAARPVTVTARTPDPSQPSVQASAPLTPEPTDEDLLIDLISATKAV